MKLAPNGIPDFQPHPLLRSGHAQTIFTGLWNRLQIPYRAKRHLVPTSHGDTLVVHDDCPESWHTGQLCALLVHGLGGCHGSPYMVRIADKLTARNVRTFRMDQRGCGAGYHLATKPGHAGRSEDVAAVLDYVLDQCPGSPVVVAGFSLGANLVLKMLGELHGDVPPGLIRAMAVAPPIDLMACSQNMQRRQMMPYNRWFVRCLVQQTAQRRPMIAELSELDWTRPPLTLFEFDDRVTAPLSGFAGAKEYYAASSSRVLLPQIQIPTLILAAGDDPIIPVSMFSDLQESDHLQLHITRHGGHVAYIGRQGTDADRYWLDWRVVEYVVGGG